jgi:hypothetical protein
VLRLILQTLAVVLAPWLRSSPAPEGRCCARQEDSGSATDDVAILTGPGGPVLPGAGAVGMDPDRLRFSPAPEGRCCGSLAGILRRSGGCFADG